MQMHADIPTQVQALGQKYLGRHPHGQQPMRDTSLHADEGHPVPVDNFMNAQCTHGSGLDVGR